MGCEVRAGRRAGERVRGGSDGMHGAPLKAGGQGTRGAHVEHVGHGRDAGGVEAQRLVEGRRALSSRREGMRCGGERCEPGGGRAWGGGGTQEACTGKMAQLKAWGSRARAESAQRTCSSCQ